MPLISESIFRAYDMRGIYPTEINESIAYAAGQAVVKVLNAKTIVVGRDVRLSGPSLHEAVLKGILEAGANVIDVGIISTEMLYFAVGSLGCDGGLSITASHNPAEWNGMKFVGRGAVPLLKDDKLGEIYDFIRSGEKITSPEPGKIETIDLLPRYVEFLKPYMPTDLPNLTVVANTNFGANGPIVDAVCQDYSLNLIRLNFEQDGTFPKGKPDPFLPKNREELSKLIVVNKANFGVAWDADADRCFLFDNQGRLFHGTYVAALLIKHLLAGRSNENIVLERRIIRPILDAATEAKGNPIYSLVGHGFIKRTMRANNAIFAGESSGHFYYRDFFTCDNGMITFLIMTQLFGDAIKNGQTVSELLDEFLAKYPITQEELNFTVPDTKKILDAATQKYASDKQDFTDGLTVEYPTWRFNLRGSSNEPVVRINAEATTQTELDQRKAELMTFMTEHGAVLRNDS